MKGLTGFLGWAEGVYGTKTHHMDGMCRRGPQINE